MGGLTRRFSDNPNEVIDRLARRTGAETHLMQVPLLANSAEDRDVLLAQEGIVESLGLAAEADLMLVGIGTTDDEASLVSSGMIGAEEIAELRSRGAVGEMLGHFFDDRGRPVESAVTRRIVHVGLDRLRGRRIVALAGGSAQGRCDPRGPGERPPRRAHHRRAHRGRRRRSRTRRAPRQGAPRHRGGGEAMTAPPGTPRPDRPHAVPLPEPATMSNATTQVSTRATGTSGRSFDLVRLLLEGRAFFALIVIIVVFSLLSPNYFSLSNFLTMANHVAIYGLLSIGMLLVILNGGIDLSVGSVLALCGVIAGALMQGVTIEALGVILYLPVWAVVVVTCVFGAFVGAINGVLIAYLKVPAFVATLGTLYVARGVALLMTNGLTYNNLGGKAELGNTGFNWLGFNRIGGVPIGVLVLAVVAVVCYLTLTRTAFGRWLYASGGNERAAELSGVPTKGVKIAVYVLSGICAAIAGLVLSSQLTSAGPTAGTTYELTAIAAVVIGGAALTGGRGTVGGTMLGAFVIGFLSDGLVIVGVSAYWQTVFTGAVIVLAVLLNSIQYGNRRRS